jgi:aspartate racemase
MFSTRHQGDAMKTIGLIGGMTWHSTADYYRFINEGVQKRLGGNASARLVLWSMEFAEIEAFQETDNWERMTDLMVDAARRVEAAGAECVVVCANTMHRTAEAIEAAVKIPLLHVADATAAEIRRQGLASVGLLGTRYTMEMEFYRKRLEEKHGLVVLVPEPAERRLVHSVIYHELARGVVKDESLRSYLEVMDRLARRGAQGIILGCTEIPLLIKPKDTPLPLFDTTALHSQAAVDFSLSEE